MRTRIILSVCLLVALASAAGAAVHVVNQINNTFVPNDITIDVGDTVQWVHSSGSHTVTNGTGPTDPLVGTLFDALLTTGTFSYVFTVPGDVPYFCRPHVSLGMTGIVRVNPPTAAADGFEGASWSRVKTLYR